MKSKIFTLLLVIVAGVGSLNAQTSGTCGENLTWIFQDSTLTISGSGAMTDWFSVSLVPWGTLTSSIKQISLPNGLTSIGSRAFYSCNINSVTIPDSVISIGESAFSNCRKLTSLTFPNSVTSIGAMAFLSCRGITSITIPSSVSSIGSYAFNGCVALTTVTLNSDTIVGATYTSSYNLKSFFGEQVTEYILGNSVKGVGDYAFYGCSSLTSISIPTSVTSIGTAAFNSCNSLGTIHIFDLASWCRINVNSPFLRGHGLYLNGEEITNLVIPDGITSIGKYAFFYCTNLASIVIPDGVTSIGDYAFYGCSGLTSVSLSNSVNGIGAAAFNNCRGITSITIPNSVTSIGESAFNGCSGLTSITLPDHITSIDDKTFYGCSSLTAISVPDSVTHIGTQAFYNCSGLTSVSLPNCVSSIGDAAFYNCRELAVINIPDSVTTINDRAFYNCSRLDSIVIPRSVTNIGEEVFTGCVNLKFVTIKSDSIANRKYNDTSNISTIFGSQVINYKLDNGVTGVGSYAFYNCDSMVTVILGNDIIRVENNAFAYCDGLTSITIPDNVEYMGRDAFLDCHALTEVVTHDLASWCSIAFMNETSNPVYYAKHLYINNDEVINLIIPDSITRIYYNAFINCSSITTVSIPENVTGIGSKAFCGCSALTSVCIPSTVSNIGNSAFYDCSGLASISLPSSLTNIGDDTFYGCSGLTSISLPDNITSIGNRAFYDCNGLTSISLPNSLTSIGYAAFYGCSGLTSISLPNSLTNIGHSSFYGCSGLTSIIIPTSVISIGNQAFVGCNALDSIIWNSKTCADYNASTSPFCTVNYYNHTLSDNSTITTFIFGDSVEYIPAYLCANIRNLSSVKIPEQVYQIGTNAFVGCTGLDSVIWNARNCADFTTPPFYDSRHRINAILIGDSVQHIPANLCNGLNRIKEITIPDKVETIGPSVFVGCDSLTRVDITNLSTWCSTDFTATSTPLRTAELYVNGAKPQRIDVPNGLTKVGSFSLINCSQLTEVLLPPSVTEIGESAFAGESRLQTVTLDANLTTIGDSAFNNCPYLITVNANMEFPPLISSSVFANCGDLSYVDCNVPQNSLGLYRKTAVWSSFSLHGTPTFTVSFVDWDNTPIASQTVLQGTDATAPENPTRDGYTFTGWSANFTNVQSDLTIIAQYEQDTPSDFELIGEGDSLSNSVRKVFENGQLYIVLPDGIRYDVTGRRIK